jgi:hypothetical protein
MGIPCLQKVGAAFYHQRSQAVQFVRTETAGFREVDRFEPKFRNVVTLLYVDMWRLRSFQAVKEEAESGSP